MGWGGRWEGGSGWETHVNPWLIHVNVWFALFQTGKVSMCSSFLLRIKWLTTHAWHVVGTMLVYMSVYGPQGRDFILPATVSPTLGQYLTLKGMNRPKESHSFFVLLHSQASQWSGKKKKSVLATFNWVLKSLPSLNYGEVQEIFWVPLRAQDSVYSHEQWIG